MADYTPKYSKRDTKYTKYSTEAKFDIAKFGQAGFDVEKTSHDSKYSKRETEHDDKFSERETEYTEKY